MQPWRFVVAGDAAIKRRIQEAAERREYEFYHSDATKEWRDDLADLGTDYQKPFLEDAPYLIVVFAEVYGLAADGARRKHYYVRESVGIAVGMLIAAIHNAGLVTLPYTPPRAGFLSEILERPENERPFVVLPVGYPAEDAKVPDIKKKTLGEIALFL
jgi:nitroreductase